MRKKDKGILRFAFLSFYFSSFFFLTIDCVKFSIQWYLRRMSDLCRTSFQFESSLGAREISSFSRNIDTILFSRGAVEGL